MTIPRARLLAYALTVAATVVVWAASFDAETRSGTSMQAVIRATAIPLAVAFLPLVLAPLQRTSAALLLVFSALGAMSAGLFYLPSAIVMFFPEPPPKTPAC